MRALTMNFWHRVRERDREIEDQSVYDFCPLAEFRLRSELRNMFCFFRSTTPYARSYASETDARSYASETDARSYASETDARSYVSETDAMSCVHVSQVSQSLLTLLSNLPHSSYCTHLPCACNARAKGSSHPTSCVCCKTRAMFQTAECHIA